MAQDHYPTPRQPPWYSLTTCILPPCNWLTSLWLLVYLPALLFDTAEGTWQLTAALQRHEWKLKQPFPGEKSCGWWQVHTDRICQQPQLRCARVRLLNRTRIPVLWVQEWTKLIIVNIAVVISVHHLCQNVYVLADIKSCCNAAMLQ